MDIDDSSYSRHTARAGQPGAGPDQDMTEVAEILLKMNVNSARQRRYRQSTVLSLFSHCLFDCPRFAVVHRSIRGAETSSLGHSSRLNFLNATAMLPCLHLQVMHVSHTPPLSVWLTPTMSCLGSAAKAGCKAV